MKKYFLLGFVIVLYVIVIYKIYSTQINTPIKVLIFQQNYNIKNINNPLKNKFYKKIYIDKLYFPLSKILTNPLYSNLNFKQNFFMYIYTNFYLKKDANISFNIISDDGFNLYIDNNKICGFDNERSFSSTKCNISLKKGKHKLFIKYFQGIGHLGIVGKYKYQKKFYYIGENSNLIEFY